jgi:hypothetical protein
VGTVGATGLAGMVAMANEAVESENLFTVSLGKNAEAVRSWSEGLRKDLGLNSVEVRKSSATFYAMFESMKLGEENSLKLSKGLTQLSYDMASFYNLDPSVAFEKLQAGISGETEPLKQLGIIVSETTVNNYAMTQGMIKQGEQLNEQGKVMARYGVIMEATAKAQGDMARTLDSPVNQLRIMGEQAKQTAIAFGTLLIPMEQKVITELKKFTDYMSNLSDEERENMVQMALWGVGLSLLIGTALKGTLAIMELIATMRELGIVISAAGAAKFGIWAAAIAAAVTIAVMAYDRFENKQKEILNGIDNQIKANNNLIKSRQEDASSIKNLVSEYDELKTKAKLTAIEQERIHEISEKLKDLIPNVNGVFKEQGGIFDVNTTAALKYADQLNNVKKIMIENQMLQAKSDLQKSVVALEKFSPLRSIFSQASGNYRQFLQFVESKSGHLTRQEINDYRGRFDWALNKNDQTEFSILLDDLLMKNKTYNMINDLSKQGKLQTDDTPPPTGSNKTDYSANKTGDKKKDELTFRQRYEAALIGLGNKKAGAYPGTDMSGDLLSLYNSYIDEFAGIPGSNMNDPRVSGIIQARNELQQANNQASKKKIADAQLKQNAEYWKKYNEVNPNIMQSQGLTPGQFNHYESSENGRYTRYGERSNPQGGRVGYNGGVGEYEGGERTDSINFDYASSSMTRPGRLQNPNATIPLTPEQLKKIAEMTLKSDQDAYLKEIAENTAATERAVKGRDNIGMTLAALGQGGSLGEMASGFMSQIATKGFTGAMSSWIENSDKNNGLAPWLKSKLFGTDGKPGKGLTAISSLYTAYQGASEGGALGGALAGAEAGMTIGGPIGAGIGALAGLLFGGSEASKRAQERAEALQAAQLEQLRKLNNAIVPVSDYFRSAGLNMLPSSATFGSGNLATSYAVQSSRGVR